MVYINENGIAHWKVEFIGTNKVIDIGYFDTKEIAKQKAEEDAAKNKANGKYQCFEGKFVSDNEDSDFQFNPDSHFLGIKEGKTVKW